jgi:putative membrane protein
MKQKKLIKELNLSEKDFEEIKNKIAEIELKTSGEIAVAVAPESAHYSFWELLAANGIASILIIFLLPFANAISKLYEKLYWQNQPSWIMPAFFIVTFLASVVLIFYLCNIPFIDRLVIPGKVRRNCVTHRAFRYFTESGIYKTKENSGILIFVFLFTQSLL